MCLGFWFDSSAWRRYSSGSFFSFGGGFLVLGIFLFVCRFKQLWCDCISRRRGLLQSRVMCGGGKRCFDVFSFYLRVLREFLNLPSLWLILLQDLSFFLFSFWKLNLRFEFHISILVSRPFFPCGCSTWMMTETRLSKTTLFEWNVRAIISPAIRENGAVVSDRSGGWQRWHQKLLSNPARKWRWSPPVPFLVRSWRIEFRARTPASQVLWTLLYKYFCKLFDLFSWCMELSRYQRFYRIYAKTDVGVFPKMSRTLLARWRRRN
jgi:hypothetical protein